jgi:hypothetical protein
VHIQAKEIALLVLLWDLLMAQHTTPEISTSAIGSMAQVIFFAVSAEQLELMAHIPQADYPAAQTFTNTISTYHARMPRNKFQKSPLIS